MKRAVNEMKQELNDRFETGISLHREYCALNHTPVSNVRRSGLCFSQPRNLAFRLEALLFRLKL